MKKYPKFGTRLFARDFVMNKHVESLPVAAAIAAKQIRKDRPGIDAVTLRKLLGLALEIRPLHVGPLQSITIECDPRTYLNDYNVKSSGYLASTRIPYSGSAMLWKQQLSHGYALPYAGTVSDATVKLATFLDWPDFQSIEAALLKDLALLRAALLDLEPMVKVFSKLAIGILDECVAGQIDLPSRTKAVS